MMPVSSTLVDAGRSPCIGSERPERREGCLPPAQSRVPPGQPSCLRRALPACPVNRPIGTALEALYEATDGANWSNNANWLSEASLREWHGVITDRNGRVTGLSLSGNRLWGEIPAELGSLANLQRLYLHQNQLGGEIPAELGDLSNLRILDLGINELTGKMPPELGNMSNLKYLSLSYNELTGKIPPELGGLANLEILSLSGLSLFSFRGKAGEGSVAETGRLPL